MDGRLNCAAAICCPGAKAQKATEELLEEFGVNHDDCYDVAERMKAAGVVFLPVELANVIREIAFPEQ